MGLFFSLILISASTEIQTRKYLLHGMLDIDLFLQVMQFTWHRALEKIKVVIT